MIIQSKHHLNIGLVVTTLILALIAGGLFNSYRTHMIEKFNIKEAKIVELTTKYNDLNTLYTSTDFDKQSIESYISLNYKQIPDEISHSIAEHLLPLCTKYNVPYELVMGIIEVESSFNPSVSSSKEARGLMQVMPSVWVSKLKIDDKFKLHQIEFGIETGLKVLTIILAEQNGSMSEALFYYVGKDRNYVHDVYERMGRFILHRSLLKNKYTTLEPKIEPLTGSKEKVNAKK